MTERPVFVLRLQPLRGVEPIPALRRLLKLALRACGLKCLAVERERPEGRP